VVEEMRDHAQRLRQLVLRLVDGNLSGGRGTKNRFWTSRGRWRFLVEGHAGILVGRGDCF
jgi:hypothetical protein